MEGYNEIITVDELIEILFISRNYAYKLLNKGKIKVFRVGRTWRTPRNSLDEFITNGCIENYNIN
ncbi:MAG: hypothetical protein PWP27_1737 [Clostridiales bacterium]|jgi:excisionase family DNA binding protein|nr:hypothetical protein [Clostridiales bacterium]